MSSSTHNPAAIRTGAALLAIVALALALRVYFFAGYVGLDDGEYARFAYRIAQGEFAFSDYDGPAVFPLRVGLYYPVAAVIAAFGFGEWSVIAYPLFLSVAGLLLTYFCAAKLFEPRVGLIAATLYAIVPVEVASATSLFPDLPAAVYASVGVAVLVVAMRANDVGGRRAYLMGAVAGLAFGASWLCKETVAYFVLTAAALMFLSLRESKARSLPIWIGVAIGSLLVIAAESIVYATTAGDWLFRLHEIERNYRQWPNGFFTEGSAMGWEEGGSRAVALVKRLFISGPRHALLNASFLYLPLLACIGTVHAVLWKDRAFLLPAVWLFTLLFMFNFGSSSTSSYIPLPLFGRYWYPVIIPAAILSAAFLGRLLLDRADADGGKRKEQRFWGGLAACALVAQAVETLYWQARPAASWTAEVRSLRDRLTPVTPLYADTLTLRALEFFNAYPESTRWVDFSQIASANFPVGSQVLVNSAYIDWLQVNSGMWLNNLDGYPQHDFYTRPPATWDKLVAVRRAVLYGVN